MIRREDVGPDSALGQSFRLNLPASDETIAKVTADTEWQWWRMVAMRRVVVTELPVTTHTKIGRDLAAAIDAQLPQPYGYEPPMDLIIRVEGRGAPDIRPTTTGE